MPIRPLIVLLIGLFTAPYTAAALPAVDAFFGSRHISVPKLSPSSRYLAMHSTNTDGRHILVVVDLNEKTRRVVANYADFDVAQFEWVNDRRLVYDLVDKHVGAGKRMFAPGINAVDRDGENFKQLVSMTAETAVEAVQAFKLKARERLSWNHYLFDQTGLQDSDSIYVINPEFENNEVKYIDLVLLDTVSGRSKEVVRPSFAHRWILDHQGEPRLVISKNKNLTIIHYKDPKQGQWRKLHEFDRFTGTDGYQPLAFGPDGTLFVSASISSDKRALYKFDFATNSVDKNAIVILKDFDFDGALIRSKDKLLGVRFRADAESTEWFDPDMQALQKTVDAMLPTTVNLISVGVNSSTPWVLIDSFSDVQAHTYLAYNRQSKALAKVGGNLSDLNPSQLGRLRYERVKARDGLDLPVWVTSPRGTAGKPAPMVVLVHGGPFLRGTSWDFDAEAQFLASRGYVVLQPEFRGSTGYGRKHYEAGWKQWGLAMQNDIADATRWAIAKGIADPKRICIAGASYGGYATLMGLINDPDLFKCGVQWAGVTDINLMYNGHWSRVDDISSAYREYGMPTLIGDQVKDAAQLKATSPIELAQRIKQPLLLAYGGSDKRVPIYHGKKFYEAVKAGNTQVEWISYSDEGHGWSQPETRIDFWSRVETFLAKQIGQ